MQARVRDTIACTDCKKPRIIYSEKNAQKNPQLSRYIGEIRSSVFYTCGSALPANNPGGCYVNVNLTCGTTIEQSYYKLDTDILCAVCAAPLEDDLLQKFRELSEKYSVVKPSCEGDCGPFSATHPRRVPKKNPKQKRKASVTKKKKPPAKKVCVSPWDKGGKGKQ